MITILIVPELGSGNVEMLVILIGFLFKTGKRALFYGPLLKKNLERFKNGHI